MPISFGVEFEFDVINQHGQRAYPRESARYAHIDGWGFQPDPTATVELRTPIFTDLRRAAQSINRQFTYWMEANSGLAPYPFNERGRSLGQHLHVGRAQRRRLRTVGDTLTREEKRRVSKAASHVYPFLATIHAQPIPSHRGLNSTYCTTVAHRLHEIPLFDHYAEISDSHNGTVEFRLFDSNIPQCSLVAAWALTRVAEKALERRSAPSQPASEEAYSRDRNEGLRHGLAALDVPQYLRRLRELMSEPSLPDLPCVKEILYMAARYYMNPYQVYSYLNPSPYRYFREAFTHAEDFLRNFLRAGVAQHRDQVERWVEEASRVETIDELIGLAEASRERAIQALAERAQPRQVAPRTVTRAMVRRLLEEERFYVPRIYEVRGWTTEEVAQRISELLRRHGEGVVNEMSPSEVINANERFYVLAVPTHDMAREEILGCIAVRVRTGEILHLVVDRRFRGLGIARRLVQHVLSLGLPSYYTWVRKGNEASLRLFKSLGFRVEGRNHRSLRLRLGQPQGEGGE